MEEDYEQDHKQQGGRMDSGAANKK